MWPSTAPLRDSPRSALSGRARVADTRPKSSAWLTGSVPRAFSLNEGLEAAEISADQLPEVARYRPLDDAERASRPRSHCVAKLRAAATFTICIETVLLAKTDRAGDAIPTEAPFTLKIRHQIRRTHRQAHQLGRNHETRASPNLPRSDLLRTHGTLSPLRQIPLEVDQDPKHLSRRAVY